MPTLAFCSSLPKAELHSHLNGTIRPATLLELLTAHAPDLLPQLGPAGAGALPTPAASPSLSECFRTFDLIHAAVCTPQALARVAREAVEDAAADNVRYLELRTTPRPLPGSAPGGAALEAYAAAVAQGILAASATSRCAVRLLFSLDRAAQPEAWEGVAGLARAWSARAFLGLQPFPLQPSVLLVGVDVSGHPGRGSVAPLFPLLASLRAPPHALRIAFHAAELPGTDAEVEAVLAFAPERLGHMCALTPQRLAQAAAQRLTIELCPTSNLVTLQLPSLAHHPTLPTHLASPTLRLAMCTAVGGVFHTSLSAEYERVAQAFGLEEERLAQLAAGSFACGFASADVLAAAAQL